MKENTDKQKEASQHSNKLKVSLRKKEKLAIKLMICTINPEVPKKKIKKIPF